MRTPLAALLSLALVAPLPRAQDCADTSVGFVPLADLADGAYQGFQGGLYPGGELARPTAHDAAGLAQAAEVLPRGPSGAPAPNGRVVLLSLGMSNATQEFSAFRALVQGDPTLSPRLTIVDGAIGGWTASEVADPAAAYWTLVDQRLAQAGVTPAQVQAVWLKEAEAGPSDPFPQHAETLSADLAAIARNARARYPNLRLLYLASRIYAGYATSALNPEPFAYESGFAVKWLIEAQIAGDPPLAFDAAQGAVVAPWLAWGPYLWADGLVPRSDGLVWECSDFAPDGTHPGPSARAKVAALLSAFFRTDATARGWFLAASGPSCGPQALATKYGAELGGAQGAVQLVASALPIQTTSPPADPLRAHAFGAPPNAPALFLIGAASIPDGAVPAFGGSLLVDFYLALPAAADATGRLSLALGAIPPTPLLCGLQRFVQVAVLDPTAPQGVGLSRGLRLRIGH
jgi:hypothetical protein